MPQEIANKFALWLLGVILGLLSGLLFGREVMAFMATILGVIGYCAGSFIKCTHN